MAQQKINYVKIATGTPQANGQIERMNRILTPLLAKGTHTTKTWDEVLGKAEFCINNTVNRATGETPSRLLFGINQVQLADELSLLLSEQTEFERDLTQIRAKAAKKVQKAQEYNEQYYNNRHIKVLLFINKANMS